MLAAFTWLPLLAADSPKSTEIGLRDYVDMRIEEMKGQTALALSAQKEAQIKSEAAIEKRFESVNEFRATLSDQAKLMMPRTEAAQQFESLNNRLAALMLRVNDQQSRAQGGADTWILLGGIFTIVLAAATFVIMFLRKDNVRKNNRRNDNPEI